MGINQSNRRKRKKSGGKKSINKKKREFDLGRPALKTKIGPEKVMEIRVRGGGKKLRAVRLNNGEFHLASQGVEKVTSILNVVYNETGRDFVRAKILAKSAIVQVDPKPFGDDQAPLMYAKITSRPGQVGKVVGYILEGEELQSYLPKLLVR